MADTEPGEVAEVDFGCLGLMWDPESGRRRLVWGSDIPNVERYCTYAESLNYLKNYCSFLSDSDKELILGKNVMEIFELNSR